MSVKCSLKILTLQIYGQTSCATKINNIVTRGGHPASQLKNKELTIGNFTNGIYKAQLCGIISTHVCRLTKMMSFVKSIYRVNTM